MKDIELYLLIKDKIRTLKYKDNLKLSVIDN